MNYFVTFCVMDQKVGANPLWHSCLLLSKWEGPGHKVEVVDTFGFYGMPSTSVPGSWTAYLKRMMDLKVDVSGSHGYLRRENIGKLDKGVGLHGTTFELTPVQFEMLQENIKGLIDAQSEAVADLYSKMELTGGEGTLDKKNGYPIGKAHLARSFFAIEKEKAAEEQRPSRLKPFEIEMRLSWSIAWLGLLPFPVFGPDFSEAKTCKTQNLEVLETILSKEHLSLLTENGQHPSLPRFSGDMTNLYLHSEQDTENQTRLFWTIPPQQVIRLEDKLVDSKPVSALAFHWACAATTNLPAQYQGMRLDLIRKLLKFIGIKYPQKVERSSDLNAFPLQLNPLFSDRIERVVERLQQIEWLFRNATLPPNLESYRTDLIERLCEYYNVFARIAAQDDILRPQSMWENLQWMWSYPKPDNEADADPLRKTRQAQTELMAKIVQAEELLCDLYTAISHDWTIDADFPSERDVEKGLVRQFAETKAEHPEVENDAELDEDVESVSASEEESEAEAPYCNPLGALANYLDIKDQRALCSILGKTYVEPEPIVSARM